MDDPRSHHAGSPQSLIGDLIAEGVTGTVGFVYEPYLDGTARPDVLFPAYRAGYTLAESFYMALRYLSWQSVVIGDPLVAPFETFVSARPAPPPGMLIFLERRTDALGRMLARTDAPELRRSLALVHAERARELAQADRLDAALEAAKQASQCSTSWARFTPRGGKARRRKPPSGTSSASIPSPPWPRRPDGVWALSRSASAGAALRT